MFERRSAVVARQAAVLSVDSAVVDSCCLVVVVVVTVGGGPLIRTPGSEGSWDQGTLTRTGGYGSCPCARPLIGHEPADPLHDSHTLLQASSQNTAILPSFRSQPSRIPVALPMHTRTLGWGTLARDEGFATNACEEQGTANTRVCLTRFAAPCLAANQTNRAA